MRIRLPAGSPGPVGDVPTGRAVPAGGGGQRILVVEDEDGVRDIVCRILKKAGHDLYAAGDPQEALKLGLDGNLHVDALLSDVIMPGMSGTQLAAELRKSRPVLPRSLHVRSPSGPPSDAPLFY